MIPLLAPISLMFQSRKAVVLVFAIAGVVLMNYLGRISGEEALAFVKWVVTAWLAAQAIEDTGKHVGNGIAARGSVTPTPSIVPPADK